MKKEIAELLIEHNRDLNLYENYSGRGMYGKTTTGISCDDMAQVMEAVGECFLDMIYDASSIHNDTYDTSDAEDLVDALTNFQTDSLGLGIIVY